MEQGRMMDAGVNPVVVDYDANSLSLFMERCFRFERFRSWNFTGRKSWIIFLIGNYKF